MDNYYKILGVKEQASNTEIKRAYHKLIKNIHPDLYKGDKVFAEKQCAKLNIAYNTLSKDLKRNIYDRKLKESRQSKIVINKTTAVKKKVFNKPLEKNNKVNTKSIKPKLNCVNFKESKQEIVFSSLELWTLRIMIFSFSIVIICLMVAFICD